MRVEGVNEPGYFWLKKRGQCALRKRCVWLCFGFCLRLFQGNQGLLLGLTVLFPVLLRLPPVGYEPNLGFLRNW